MTRKQIITAAMLPGADGSNINGPSVIRVPDWLPDAPGRYLLYFAHHFGSYIRLAYADSVEGPWHVHPGGCLSLADTPGCRDHIASPDVHVDEDRREIRLYFHGKERETNRQSTFVACSRDGIRFKAMPDPLCIFYLRAVRWRGYWLGMTKGGVMHLSADGLSGFRQLPRPAFPMGSSIGDAPGDVRHVALLCRGDDLLVYFTRIGDAPEHIRCGHIDLSRPIDSWRVSAETVVIKPEFSWEGAGIASGPSRAGPSAGPENALRDPAILVDEGNCHLFYSYAGEQGLAVSRIDPPAVVTGTSKELTSMNGSLRQAAPVRPPEPAIAAELAALSRPGRLQKRLEELDADNPVNRIFLMGCGRSGTWLLTAVMTSFAETAILPKELSVEYFGMLKASTPNFVLKRDWRSYETAEAIPPSIRIIHIVRHPYAVLTSSNPMEARRYYNTPGRWLGEMMALKFMMDSGRPGLTVVRYEDLVNDPEKVQSAIAAANGLSIATTPQEAMLNFRAPPEADKAMHGVRPIDRVSLNRYRDDPEKLAYLRSIRTRLEPMASWVAEQFGYDLSL